MTPFEQTIVAAIAMICGFFGGAILFDVLFDLPKRKKKP